ncbi:MAG TPA: SgcJ/EcaC family oxidoreductase [Candidatus Binataceae bacterium]|nr:SgcJ/EcaC family oxidoreductase [Candidatus Binataceae bacterium]
MHRSIIASALAALFCANPAFAGSTDIGMAHSEAFEKACGSGNIPQVMALYEDDADVIWPGQGDVAKGKDAIAKLVSGYCKPGAGQLKLESQSSRELSPSYIVNVGRWKSVAAGADGKPTELEVRTTEVLHRGKDGRWRYIVDHASIGAPPAQTAPAAGKPASS